LKSAPIVAPPTVIFFTVPLLSTIILAAELWPTITVPKCNDAGVSVTSPVGVGVVVGVGVGVVVAVGVAVGVGVCVGSGVRVGPGVPVAVGVEVGVGPGGTAPYSYAPIVQAL
jgi:hypothetical protein